MIHNKIIAVDYDGTCTTKNNFPNVGEIRDGLKYCVDRLKENGNILILWTCRHDEKLEEAKNHLIKNGIEFDYYNENPSFLIEKYGDCRKMGADFFIDDKNLFCNEINWFDIFRYFDSIED